MSTPADDRRFAAELRELITAAHGAAKDLRRENKEAGAAVADGQRALAETVRDTLENVIAEFMKGFARQVEDNQLVDADGLEKILKAFAVKQTEVTGNMLAEVADAAKAYTDKTHDVYLQNYKDVLDHAHWLQVTALRHEKTLTRLCAALSIAGEADNEPSGQEQES